MNKRIEHIVWSLGVRARDKVAQFGLLGLGEGVLFRLANPVSNLAPGDTTTVIDAGLQITAPNSYTGLRYIEAGLYERAVSQLFRNFIKPGMTVVDLGANIGYYTLLASNLSGKTGRVYSFEPDPGAYVYLRRNVESNRCTNVEAVKLAVGASISKGWFNSDPHLAEGYLTINPEHTSTLVDVVSLDEYFSSRGWPPVELVKMDVEGNEGPALAGMKLLAKRNREMRLVVEFSPKALRRSNTSPEELATVIQEIGYSQGYIIERRMKPFSIENGLPHSSATYNLLFVKGRITQA
jgi:FkbM family methyltransferase